MGPRGRRIIAGNNQRFRVLHVDPFDEEDSRRSSGCYRSKLRSSAGHARCGEIGAARRPPEGASGGTCGPCAALRAIYSMPRVPLTRPGKKVTGGRGYGARPAYEAVAAKGDVTASDSWTGSCTTWFVDHLSALSGPRVAHGAACVAS